ncbi:hypothetical protein C1646_688135 [Rhizophagus diaphanus]|nr:hypothetical protein C1646_688135 [Rhizophagus diaphanus] [Rhizophagus sp. MUCL 43196]
MVFALTYDANEEIILKIFPSHKSKVVLLNTANNLLITRQKLKEDYDINDTLLKFLWKFSENDEKIDKPPEIELKDERKIRLCKIIDKGILYIKSCVDWNHFNKKNKLDHGCTMASGEIMKADKRAFIMKNCELKEIGAEGFEKGVVEFESTEERIKLTNLFFTANINVDNFVKLGMSIGSTENNKSNHETSGSYHFIKHAKASLEFTKYLEPTPDFIKEVEGAIVSENPSEKFKQIIAEYGHFIPTRVILGGRVHFNEHITSTGNFTEHLKEVAMNTNAGGILETSISGTSNYSKGSSNYQKFNCAKLIGGESPDSLENFNEEAWVKSLKENHEKWDSIEFQNPVSIFQPLSEDLREKIIKSLGKRIHYSTIEDFKYRLEEFGRPKKFELKIPSNIMKVIQNEGTDCNIFATVIDMTVSNNDFFTCQVLCPPNGKPSLIIHCIQKKFKRIECILKIGWMVIGYYTKDFNVILSDFNAQLKILKNVNISDNQTMINAEILNVEYDSYVHRVPPCLGIPVLTKLDSSKVRSLSDITFLMLKKKIKLERTCFLIAQKIIIM